MSNLFYLNYCYYIFAIAGAVYKDDFYNYALNDEIHNLPPNLQTISYENTKGKNIQNEKKLEVLPESSLRLDSEANRFREDEDFDIKTKTKN